MTGTINDSQPRCLEYVAQGPEATPCTALAIDRKDCGQLRGPINSAVREKGEGSLS